MSVVQWLVVPRMIMPRCGAVAIAGTLAASLVACVALPIPTKERTVSGEAAAAAVAQSSVQVSEEMSDVKSRLGEPIISYGPGAVFVYQWTISNGRLVWMMGGPGALVGGAEPLTESNLLLIAFDGNGKVLMVGTRRYDPLHSINAQVRKWLASNDLGNQIRGPKPREHDRSNATLFVYHPIKSRCPFPTFDSDIFKPVVSIDEAVVGESPRGEYLAVNLEPGRHSVKVQPAASYQFAGQESGTFLPRIHWGEPIVLEVSADTGSQIYVKVGLCTGTGRVEIDASLRAPDEALPEVAKLVPSW